MKKAVLKFDLPEDLEEYEHSIRGPRYHAALCSFSEWLRQQTKYRELSADEQEIYNNLKTAFFGFLSEYDIELG
jgi:hypothetical protein